MPQTTLAVRTVSTGPVCPVAESTKPTGRFRWWAGVARGGVEPPTYRFSGDRSYRLSYLAERSRKNLDRGATQTGLEPATFAVTGRRANQLRHWALIVLTYRTPNGIRTRVAALKGRSPRPLNDGGATLWLRTLPANGVPVGSGPSIGDGAQTSATHPLPSR
jgi:hypothetical protein